MAKKTIQVESRWLLGVPALCAYLGGIDDRTCKAHFLDKGLQPVWSVNDKLNYYDKAEVDAFVLRNYRNQRVKL